MATKTSSPVTNYIELTVKELMPMLGLAFKERSNLFIIGDPGLGKTEQIGAFAKSLGKDARFVTLVASMLDRLDIAGLPYRTDKNTTEFALMTSIAEATKELHPDGPPTVIYLNEVNAAPDSVQPALLRLLNERAVSGYTLRDNVMLVADGNHSTSSRIAREMPEPAKRRFVWVHVRVDKRAWMEYSTVNGCDARVMAFVQAYDAKGVLCDFREGERGRITYACPASWTKIGIGLKNILADLESPNLRKAWIAGHVGAGIGEIFSAFLEHQNSLPDIGAFLAGLLTDKSKVVIPEKLDARYMLLGMIANRVHETLEEKEILGSLILIQLLLDSGSGEEAIFFFRTLNNENTKKVILKLPEFKTLCEKFRANKHLWAAIMESSAAATKEKK